MSIHQGFLPFFGRPVLVSASSRCLIVLRVRLNSRLTFPLMFLLWLLGLFRYLVLFVLLLLFSFSASVHSHVSRASSWSNLPRHRARISGLLGDFRAAEDGGLDHHASLSAMYLYTGLPTWYSAHLLTVDELREIYKLSVLQPSSELHCPLLRPSPQNLLPPRP